MKQGRIRIIYSFILCAILLLGLRLRAAAATPIIPDYKSFPPDCYYHYDGQIWVYSTSSYKKEVKKAVKLLNKRFNIFRLTQAKTKRDVWVKDKTQPPVRTIIALTTQYTGSVVLYKGNMRKLNSSMKVLTIAHELCHAAGLDHAGSRSSLMYPYIDKSTAVGLSGADVKALKKARTRAANRNNSGRLYNLNLFLKAEKYNLRLRMHYRPGQANSVVLAFPRRGTSYKSSNSGVLSVQANGMLQLKRPGQVTLTVVNAGKTHVFRIVVV